MRIAIACLLGLCGMGLVATAQLPRETGDPPSIVIRPMRPGESLEREVADKSGFIVIRPAVKATTTQVAEPKSRNPVLPPQNVAGIINVPPPEPAANEAKLQFDYWFAVGVDGQRAGYVNWSAKELEQNGKPYVNGVRYLNLTISRFGQTSNQKGEESTVETPEGQVLITSMRQSIGRDQSLILTGTVDIKAKKLSVRIEGQIQNETETPWPDGVVGLVREPKLFKELKLQEGESFDYPSYMAAFNVVARTTLTFEGTESKVLWPNTPARKLHRFNSKPAPIGKTKLPGSTTWVDAETFEPLMLEADFPAFGGRLTFLRTTKAAAMVPITRPIEVFNAQSIRLNREIPGIHAKESVVYGVTVSRDDEPETVFATEARQELKNLDAKAHHFELHVSARHGPIKTDSPLPLPGKEFTSSNYFINWDNADVKNCSAKAMAGLPAGASDWEKAVAIERWVKSNMIAFEFDQAMATADNVARTLRGDCTEFAMLGAAMCRAVGVPSRTALGVVYAPSRNGNPFMAYHMWFEVFVDGQWVPLDATLGQGGIGPGHIKITDHSWYDVKSYAPLFPVLRSLNAKPTIDVLKVNP